MASGFQSLQPTAGAECPPSQNMASQQSSPSPAAGSRATRKPRSGNLTVTACEACRRRKAKCDGAKPTCGACGKRGRADQCIYEMRDRAHAYRERIAQLEQENDELRQGSTSSADHLNIPYRQRHRGSHATSEGRPAWDDSGGSQPDGQYRGDNDVVRLLQEENRHLASVLGVLATTSRHPVPASQLVSEIQQNGVSQVARMHTHALASLEQRSVPASASCPQFGNESQQGHHQRVIFSANPFSEQLQGNSFVPDTSFAASSGDQLTPSNPILGRQKSWPYAGATGHQSTDQNATNAQWPGFTRPSAGNTLRRVDSNIHIFGNLPMSSSIMANGYPQGYQQSQLASYRLPLHMVSPIWLDPAAVSGDGACWANSVFCFIRTKSRSMAEHGAAIEDILGPPAAIPPDLSANVPASDPHEAKNLADWQQRFLSFFPNLSPSDKLACWIVSLRMLRWQVLGTAEAYQAIPEWYRPLPIQCFIPHMACLDVLVWPDLRELLIEAPADFVTTVMSSISVTWPYADTELLIWDENVGAYVINPAFEAWCLNLDNWSLDRSALIAMPQMAGKARFR